MRSGTCSFSNSRSRRRRLVRLGNRRAYVGEPGVAHCAMVRNAPWVGALHDSPREACRRRRFEQPPLGGSAVGQPAKRVHAEWAVELTETVCTGPPMRSTYAGCTRRSACMSCPKW